MLGWFIVPYFATTLFLGLLGLGVFFYLIVRNLISNYIFARYSIMANTPIITLDEFYITVTVLNFLGAALFVLGILFSIFGLRSVRPKGVNIYSPLILATYLIIYLTVYPIILIGSIVRIIKGDYGWW